MQLDFPALPNAANPAFVTHGNVAVVAPQQQLLALGNNVALPVYAGVDRSLGSTVADGFNLQNGVCHFHQAAAAGEKFILKISS